MIDGGGVIDQFVADANQFAILEQDLKQRAGARGFDAGFRENFGVEGTARPASRNKASIFSAARLFVLFQRDAMRRQADDVALGDDVFRAREQMRRAETAARREVPGCAVLPSRGRAEADSSGENP